MTTHTLSNGLPTIEVKPFSDTREGVASLLTVSMMQTRDTIHCDAEFILKNGSLIGLSVMFWDCTHTKKTMLELLYRVERLLNSQSLVMISSVFDIATRKLGCHLSVYEVSPDYQWEGLLPNGRL